MSVHHPTMNWPRSLFAAISMCGFTLLAPASEFESIFDGRSLAGWETPDLSYWSIEDGAITLVFGNNASKVLHGKKVTLRPAVVPDQLIVPIAWLGHAINVPKGMEVRGRDRTSLSPDTLPVEYRKG